MKARDLINLGDGDNLGNLNYETLTFRGLCNTLEEMGIRVCYL